MTGVDNGFNDSRREGFIVNDVSLAVSPDGRCFATVAENCDIALWDVQTGIHIMTIECARETCSLEFLADGHLASGNQSGEISLWDIVTGSRVQTVDALSNWVFCLSGSQSKLASCSRDKKVRVWETSSWECTSTFECVHKVESVAILAQHPNSDKVAACTSEMLYVWDTATQQLTVSKNIRKCRSVAVSNDGKWLAVAADKIILLCDASTLDCVWSHDCRSFFVSFSPDSCKLVSANLFDDKAELFDVPTGHVVKSFKHDRVVRAVFSRDGSRILSGESCSVSL